MTNIRRAAHDRRYTVIDNQPIQNPVLSWRARGLLSYLLSLPDDWRMNLEDLTNRSEKDGKHSTREGVKELIDAGHIVRNRLQDEEGKFTGYEYVVYELPKSVNTVVQFSVDGFSVDGESHTTKYPVYKVPNIQKGESDDSSDVFKNIPSLKTKIGPKHYRLLNSAAKDDLTIYKLRGMFQDGRFSSLVEWLSYRKDSKKTYPATASIIKLISQFAEYTPAEINKAVTESIQNGYQGIFPKRLSDNKVKALFSNQKRKAL